MRLLVTGSAGFLGLHVVRAALRRGHEVRALVRRNLPQLEDDPRVEVTVGDLAHRHKLPRLMGGAEAVLHLAAASSEAAGGHLQATARTTENLIAEMVESGVRRLVLVSSMAVYDYLSLSNGSVLDESSALEARLAQRDAYCRAKLRQEELAWEAARRNELCLTILRPGFIYGRDRLWTPRLGVHIGDDTWLCIGSEASIPLTYVENCADGVVLAAESQQAVGDVFNVIDDDLPTQARYRTAIASRLRPKPRILRISPMPMSLAARIAWFANERLLGGRAHLPATLRPAALAARYKPLRYSNRRIRARLGWRPHYGLDQGLERSLPA